jgi:hypothetical protein
MAGRWWWRRRVHHLRTHKYTHTRIHTPCTHICIYTYTRVCDTDTKGPKGELRPTFVQPRFLPQGHRMYTYVCVVASCKDIRTYHGKILSRRTLSHLYSYAHYVYVYTGSVTPILYIHTRCARKGKKRRLYNIISIRVWILSAARDPTVCRILFRIFYYLKYYVDFACQSKIL